MAKKLAMMALVDKFAKEIRAQDQADDYREGNRHAKRCLAAFRTLTSEYGNAGREALGVLLNHSDPRVRVTAAAFLLRYMHDESMKVLAELSKRDDMVGFGASQTIWNWNEGLWELDPEPSDGG